MPTLSGSDGLFDDYVAARWPRLVRSAVLLGLDFHAAEDVVQSALIKTYLAWDRVGQAGDPDAYVFGILFNTIKQAGRRRWAGERPVEALPASPVEGDLEHAEAGLDLLAAIRRLPMGQRQVVVLRYYADQTEASTAQLLGVPVGTVKSRLSRALAALQSETESDRSPHDRSPT